MCEVCLIRKFFLFHTAHFFSISYDREGTKVSHYIINRTQELTQAIYKIGDKTFSSMKELLTFYKQRLLDTSPLVRIVSHSIKNNRNIYIIVLVSEITSTNKV
jgi:hypothetical protein